MKVPKLAILLTLSVMVFGTFAAASALTVPGEPTVGVDYFNEDTKTHSVGIYYVGSTSIEGYGNLSKSATQINGLDVYNRPSTSQFAAIVVKANVSGMLPAGDFNDNGTVMSDANITGSVFLIVNDAVSYVSSASSLGNNATLGESGMTGYVHYGYNTVTVLYMNMDGNGTISWASDTVLVRMDTPANLANPLSTPYTVPVTMSFTDNFTSGTVDFNDPGVTASYGVNYLTPTNIVDTATVDGANVYTGISMTGTVDTTGSALLVDDILTNGTTVDYSEQDAYYDGFSNVWYNVLNGSTAVQGTVLFFDAMGVRTASSVTQATLFQDAGSYGIIAFNPMGNTLNGWETGQHITLGYAANYSANFGLDVASSSFNFRNDTYTVTSTDVSVGSSTGVTVTTTDVSISKTTGTETNTITSQTTVDSTVVSTKGAPLASVAVFFALLVAAPAIRKFRR